MRKFLTPTIVALLITAALVDTSGSPAHATEVSSMHCYVVLQPIGSSGAVPEPKCFASETAMRSAVAGLIAKQSLTNSATSSTVVLGVAHADIDEGGSSLTFYGSNACAGDTFGFSSLASA